MGGEAVYLSGHMRGPLGLLPPLPSAGKWPPAEAGPPQSTESPATSKSRFRHRPWRPAPTCLRPSVRLSVRPSVRTGQAPVRKCRLGSAPPVGPKQAGGSGPLRNNLGELAALASSCRRAQNWGKPHERGRPSPAMVTPSLATANRRLPNRPSKALRGTLVVSVPRRLMHASAGGASTTKGLTAGGCPPRSPDKWQKWVPGGKATAGGTPNTHRA